MQIRYNNSLLRVIIIYIVGKSHTCALSCGFNITRGLQIGIIRPFLWDLPSANY